MFATALLFGAFAALASAQQQASQVLFFTHVPNPVTDGQPQALTYSTNDTASPVTIILRHGNPLDLQTVEVLTTDASDGQYSWTPCSALPNGNDYVLEIHQRSQVNYYGPFVVQGASTSGTCSGIVSTASATSSSSRSSSSGASRITSSSGSSRSTASLTSSLAHNITATSSSASFGTGTAIHRNTTMSSATLSRTITSSVTTTATATTTNSGASSQSTSATPSPSGGLAADMRGSSVALVLGAVAAVLLA